MKVMVQPVLAFLVVSMVPGTPALWLHVAVMMAALPTASNAFILASQYQRLCGRRVDRGDRDHARSPPSPFRCIVYAIKAGVRALRRAGASRAAGRRRAPGHIA